MEPFRAEAALRESEERLRLATEAAQVGIWQWEIEEGRVLWSATLCAMHGITPAEFTGRVAQALRFMHPADRPRLKRAFEDAKTRGGGFDMEGRIVRPDGTVRWLYFKAGFQRAPGGEPVRALGATLDITDRKEAEEALERELADMRLLQATSTRLVREEDIEVLLKEILDAGITVMRTDLGTIQLLDPETGRLGLLAARGVEASFATFSRRTQTEAGSASSRALHEGRRVIVNDIEQSEAMRDTPAAAAYREAGIRAVQSTPLVSRDGRVLGMMSTHWREPHQPGAREMRLLDVLARQASDLIDRHQAETALRESEQNLRELSQSLERRVRERTGKLEEQAARLRGLAVELGTVEQRERKRLAALLHDHLQQLLFAALMQLHQARGRVGDEAAAAIDDAVERVVEAVDAARDLTRQLRPPALYEAGLSAALEWLASEMGDLHELAVAVEVEDEPPLSDDVRALLFECARELLFNVVKYAGVDRARVRIFEAEGRLHLIVSDEGHGFEEDALSREPQRSGFGLFSVRERVTSMGGTVEIDSGTGRGTRVELVVPVVRPERRTTPDLHVGRVAERGPEHGPPTAGSDSSAGRPRIRVLVAEDHAIVREGLANILEADERVTVVGQAADGIEALEAVSRHLPDVVLVDVNMPRLNGVEATREIRRRWPGAVVIGLSVQGDPVTEKSMLEAGAAAFVPKAGGSERLLRTIVQSALAPRTAPGNG